MSTLSIHIDYTDRPEGSFSKLNTLSDGFKVIATIFRLYKNYRPFTFFGILSAILMLIGSGFFLTILIEYFRTGLVLRFPTLFVSLFIILISIMCFVCGLILETVVSNHRQQFELRFKQVKDSFENLRGSIRA